MRKLVRYLKNYKKESVIGPLFKLLEACFELLVPLIMARIIDVGIKNKDMTYILQMGSILVLFGVLGLACSLTAQFFAAKAAVGFGTELRHDLFKHIGELSYTEVDQAGTSTLITRMTSDINQVQSGVNLVLRLFLRSPFIVVGALVMAFTISMKLSVIFIIAVPLLSLVIYGIMLITIPLYRRVQKSLDRVLLTTRENLTGVRVVRAFRTQEREKEEFAKQSDALMKLQVLVGRISALLNPVTYVIVNGAIIAIVWFGGIEVNVGALSQGEVIALVNYMSQILLALVALSNLIITFTKALASAGRINEIFALNPSIKDGNGAVKRKSEAPKIELKQVEFCYEGDKSPVLSNLDVAIKKGETIGIIGGTGSGKTTFVNLLPRFYDVTAGEVLIDGVNVKEYTLDHLRKKFGIVPQKPVLFHGTIRDNMRYGKEDATEEEIWEALHIAQATEIVKAKSDELEAIISEGGKNLSGGQRQRLTIARALVRKPDILILDDSGSALDFATDAKLRKAIREYTEEMTVLIVSQRAASIMQADRILVLDHGRIVGMGTHETLVKECKVYQEICYSQLSKEEVAKHA